MQIDSGVREADDRRKERTGKVLCYGHFDTIHAGHIRYLRYAKSLGEEVVVGLRGDQIIGTYSFCQGERGEALGLLGIADRIVDLEGDDIQELLRQEKPDVVLLGNEYEDTDFALTIDDSISEYGGIVLFHSGDTGQASTGLIGTDEKSLGASRLKDLRASLKRQRIKRKELIDGIKEFNKSKLIVIGDTIVDQFAGCEALGLSSEAPVVVVKELECTDFIGGAAIVAAHISALGSECSLVSVVGEDVKAVEVEGMLKDYGVEVHFLRDQTRPTTFKKRYLVGNQKIFRVSRLEERDIDNKGEMHIIERLRELAPECSGIVVADFSYGVITKRILGEIHELAKRYSLKIYGDSQSSSQVGNISDFKDFSLLCPNEREARLAVSDRDLGIEALARELIERTGCRELIMKLGPDGFISYERDSDGIVSNQPFPALTVNPVDVAGAGDSLLAVMSIGLSVGLRTHVAAAIGCCMASLAVTNMGNVPIGQERLLAYVESLDLDY